MLATDNESPKTNPAPFDQPQNDPKPQPSAVAAAIIVAIFFPETAGSELDTISPERTRLPRRYQKGIRKKAA